MIIHSRFKDYNVKICDSSNEITDLFNDENAYFVIDKKVFELYKEELFAEVDKERLYLVEAIEQNKQIDTVLSICESMTQLPQKRNMHLISVGGGIIQDITGLVANIIYRGIRWSFVPTTLLAACDSCIGGKTSLNYKNYKNLLGTFYPPDEIKIYPRFFHTLSEKDYCSGLGEVVKFNVLHGRETIDNIENDMEALLIRDDEILKQYIYSSLEFKKRYIEEDEFDKGIRIHLNFAHTFGHAIESVTKYAIPHGTAVAMGMVVANTISMNRGWLDIETVEKIEQLVTQIVHDHSVFNEFNIEDIIKAIRQDKKQVDNNIRAVLLNQSMNLELVGNVEQSEIENGFKRLKILLEGVKKHD